MVSRFTTVIFLLCVMETGFSQKNSVFLSGQIVTFSKDTVDGFFLVGKKSEVFSSVDFVKSKSDEPTRYFPKDLIGYMIKDRIYRRFNSKDSVQKFGRVYNEGALTLLGLNDQKTRFFIVNNLTHKSSILDKSNYERANESNLAPNQLYEIANVSVKALKGKKVQFGNRALRSFTEAYNKSADPTNAIAYKDVAIFHNIITGGPSYDFNSDYKNGFSVSYFMSKVKSLYEKKGYFIFGAGYQKATKPAFSGIAYTSTRTTFSVLPLGYRYHFTRSIVRPYVYAAAGLAFINYSGSHLYNDSFGNSKVRGTFFSGAGLAIKIGRSFVNLEGSIDSSKTYRFAVGFDLADKVLSW